MDSKLAFIVGTSNPSLFLSVAKQIESTLSSDTRSVMTITPRTSKDPDTKCTAILERFGNGEIHVDIGENLRGRNVYIMQTEDCKPDYSANDFLMELILTIQACKLSSAAKITAVIPNYFYARQDKKDRPRVPISSKMIANMLQGAGCDRVIVVDLHSAQITGFFDIPCDNLYAIKYLVKHLENCIIDSKRPRDDFVLVAPDLGGEKRINAYSARMSLPFVLAAKTRDHTKSSVVSKINVYGSTETKGKIGIIVDDMADTAGTMVKLIAGVKVSCGFDEIWVAVTHGVLSGPAIDRLMGCDLITKVIITNSIDRSSLKIDLPKLEIVDISDLLAKAIIAIEGNGSVSALFH